MYHYKLNDHPPADWEVKRAAKALLQEVVYRRIAELESEIMASRKPVQFSGNVGPTIEQFLDGFGSIHTEILSELENLKHEQVVRDALTALHGQGRIRNVTPIGGQTSWFILNTDYKEPYVDPVMKMLEGNLKMTLTVLRLEKLEKIVLKDRYGST